MAHETNELIKAPPTAHRRGDALAKAQVVLPVFAVLLAVGFGVSEWLAHGEVRYSPGGLATPHSQWDNQCAACHETSQPLAANNWFARASDQGHVADAKCQACHAGPPHHARQLTNEVVGCTACHREHLGAPGQLLAVGDAQCTACHQNLKEHFAADPKAGPLAYGNVTAFNAPAHPEFALLRDKAKDPGTIAFNHALHMIPGMGTDPKKAGPFTLARLSPNDQTRYRKPGQTSDKDPVILDCRSCHQTDANDRAAAKDHALPSSAVTPPRGQGATMAPIVYEQHCQACHPLTIDRKTPGDPKSDLLAIRHRLQPKEILETLQGRYTNLYLKGAWQPPAAGPAPVLPGKPNPQAAKAIDDKAEAAALTLLLGEHQKALEQKVLGQTTCQKCHPSLDPAKGTAQTVPPANIPVVWFKHARFDHTAHRAVDCQACHPQAFPGDKGSTSSGDVMLPGIQICATCHAPARGSGISATGGARHDCIACHTYHHGDDPLHGRGSKSRLPTGAAKTVGDFLSGK